MSLANLYSLEGFGAQTRGGEDGELLYVTNLNDTGAGSLRAALTASGNRKIAFDVPGTIELASPITVTEPFFTIDGASNRIQLKGHGLFINTHDFIIRHIRVRPGIAEGEDAVTLFGAYNGVVDHCSLSWASDEILSATEDSHDITISWCIIAEGLSPHSKGSLIKYNTRRISLHHNLYAMNIDRNPQWSGEGSIEPAIFDMRNNVIYGWGQTASQLFGSARLNCIANYYRVGAPTTSVGSFRMEPGEGRGLYLEGNVHSIYCPDGSCIQFSTELDYTVFLSLATGWDGESLELPATAYPCEPVTTTDALTAYDDVLNGAGTRLRDACDARIVQHVIDGTGAIISDPAEVGGWPDLTV